MNEVLQVIANRRSIRKYQDREVDEATITLLLKAGMAAPSAHNLQPWEFIVVTDRKTIDLIANAHSGGKMLYEAPLCICVCGDLERAHKDFTDYWVQDCSAATENILLAVEALGLGAVWCGVHPRPDRVKPVREILGLPSTVIPLNVIAVGYPDDNPPVKDKWREDGVHWQKW